MHSLRFCKHCSNPISGRPDKKYCSANCRKRFSEEMQNSFESREKKKRNYVLFDSASRLAEIYFQKSPFERLGLMKTYIAMAREGNAKMREMLSNAYLRDSKTTMEILIRANEGGALEAWLWHAKNTVNSTGAPLPLTSSTTEQTNPMMML